jgi:hypothetical protein
MSALVFVAGNAVISALEWTLRLLNPFEIKLSKLWWALNLIPAVVRQVVGGIATVTFSYTLAQFLALFCLFLMSAFIQITIKVWDGVRNSAWISVHHAENPRSFGTAESTVLATVVRTCPGPVCPRLDMCVPSPWY